MKIPTAPFGSKTSVKDSPESLKGEPQQGRPKNSKDTEKRKSKQFSPQTGAKLQLWADSAQDTIAELMNPILLDFYSRKNMRSLSSEQYEEAETTKTKILLAQNPYQTIAEDNIANTISLLNQDNINKIYNYYIQFLNGIKSSLARDLTVHELKSVKSYFYSMVYDNLT